MKNEVLRKIGLGMLVGGLITFIELPSAKAELVYDDEVSQNAQNASDTAQTPTGGIQDRAQIRKEMRRNPVVVQNTVADVGGTTVTTTTATNNNDAKDAKSEMLRRERMREELRNEDILSERLEELRLRDEQRRTKQLLGLDITQDASSKGMSMAQQTAPVSEVVTAPVTEQSKTAAAASTVGMTASATPMAVTPAQTDQLNMTQAAPVAANASVASNEKEEAMSVSLSPRGGLTNMSNGTGYDVSSRYSVGLGLGVSVSPTITFEMGYLYSEFGIAMTQANPFYGAYNNYSYGYNNAYGYNPSGKLETIIMKQNLFEGGLKAYLVGPDSRLRPFVGGGMGYSKSFINYDQKIINQMRQYGYTNLSQDYEVSSFLGYVGAGFDVRLSKSISVGALFKYYNVFSARENQKLNNAAFYSPGGYGYYGYSPYAYYSNLPDQEKQRVGGSLANSNFYSILAGLNFTF